MKKILIACNNPEIRSALMLLLAVRMSGCSIRESVTMETLILETLKYEPQIIVLDWDLPGKPERGRIEFLKQIHPDVKVVVISTQPEAARNAESADAFICKNESPEIFLKTMQEL